MSATSPRRHRGHRAGRHRRRLAVAGAAVGALVLGLSAPAGAAGEPDPTFSGDGRLTVDLTSDGYEGGYAAAVQPDGRILAAGRTGGSGGRMYVARFNADGSPDPRFSGDGRAVADFGPGDDWATDIGLGPDGTIVLAGSARDATMMAIARFTSSGAPDPTFSGDGRRTFNMSPGGEGADDVIVDGEGRLVVAGGAEIGGASRFALARFTASGALDLSFGGGDGRVDTDLGPGPDSAMALVQQVDGRLVVGGRAGGGGGERMALARYTEDGVLDPTFSGDGKLTRDTGPGYEDGAAVAVQDDGSIVLAGEAAGQRLGLFRFTATGGADSTFDGDGMRIDDRPNGPEWLSDIRLQEDGKIVFSGTQGGQGNRMLLGRYLADGSPDPTFSGDGFAPINLSPNFDVAWDLAIQPDGAIVGVGDADNGAKLGLIRVAGG